MNLQFKNKGALSLGDAFEIDTNRQIQLSIELDKMANSFMPASGVKQVYLWEIVEYIQDFTNTDEEFVYCLTNHFQWLAARGMLNKPQQS